MKTTSLDKRWGVQRGGGARRGSVSARGTRLAVEPLWASRGPVAKPGTEQAEATCEGRGEGAQVQVAASSPHSGRGARSLPEGRRRTPRERERARPGSRSSPFGRAAGRCAEGAGPEQAEATFTAARSFRTTASRLGGSAAAESEPAHRRGESRAFRDGRDPRGAPRLWPAAGRARGLRASPLLR